jgi:succinate dehydrogenase / fumarate reductase membrane anchor subunit
MVPAMKYFSQGLRMWVVQRFTAVYMFLFVVFMLGIYLLYGPFDYQHWRLFMAAPITMAAWTMFFLSLLLHAWVGIRDAVMDYVTAFAMKNIVLGALATGLIIMAVWVVRVLMIAS